MVRPSLVDRLAIVAGAALVVYGLALVYVPLAFIVSGSLLMAGAFWRRTP